MIYCRGLTGCSDNNEKKDSIRQRKGENVDDASAVVRLEVTLRAHFALLSFREASQDNPLFSSRKKILGRKGSQGDSAHENQ